ncbi:MAG: 3-oxoacyl-[acyl-carrier protein] reductase [Candidatus Azotimanducaceae bacterium]|jgi:3-oxoacyl-[acyl-carrier protein] reductase
MKNDFFDSNLLSGKTIVITGAGRGIGLEVANLMAQCGARIIAHSGRTGTAKNLSGISSSAFEADFTDTKSVKEFIDFVQAESSVIDVLINNAGTMLGRFPADEITTDQYHQLVNLNQTSVVQITSALIPWLRKSQNAAIINTVSISATTGGSSGSSIYSATKAFVSTYTKALARELAPDNIRVNAVSPGTIETDFHKRYSSEKKLESTRQSIPLQRLGTPEDCSPAYVFLSSEKLSGYITGQIIEVNGGQLII